MTQQFWKGLFMAIMGVIVSAFSMTPVNYGVVLITLIGVVLVYFGKNGIAFFHSDSPAGAFSWINVISGLIIAIGTAITESVATLVSSAGVIDWLIVGKVTLFVTLTYISNTFFAPPYSTNKVRVFIPFNEH